MSFFEEIAPEEKNAILAKQSFELSYETIPHTKVSSDYNICLGIPTGAKGFLYMTYYVNESTETSTDTCYMMELNKERKIAKITKTPIPISLSRFANGTLLYGTFPATGTIETPEFIIEDILYYQGVPTKTQILSEKLGFIESLLKKWANHSQPKIYMAPLWIVTKENSYECVYDVPLAIAVAYAAPDFHHIQYRCFSKTAPYLNVYPMKKTVGAVVTNTIPFEIHIPYRTPAFHKPQYKQQTVFQVKADIAFDIYRLYAYGPNNSQVYYNVAYIPNYKTSVYMNGLFRNIRENKSLDAIEESDDEEDFENIACDKYVDLSKVLTIECRFHSKFKKWVPLKAVSQKKVVHIGQL